MIQAAGDHRTRAARTARITSWRHDTCECRRLRSDQLIAGAKHLPQRARQREQSGVVRTDCSTTDRQALLEATADRVEAEKKAVARLETPENGKPISEARIDIELVIDHFRYFADIARAQEGRTVETDGSRQVQTMREP